MSTNAKLGFLAANKGPAFWFISFFFAVLLLINGAYTAAFGYDFAGRVLKSQILGAIMTTTLLDLGALAWFVGRRYLAANERQYDVAGSMALACLIGSCAMTLVQLFTNVGDGVQNADTRWWVGFAGLVLLAVFAIGNFVAAYAWNLADPRELEKEQERLERIRTLKREKKVKDRARDEREKMVDEATDASFKLAAEKLHQVKPVVAERMAHQAITGYFRAVDMEDLIKPPTTLPSPGRPLTESELSRLIRKEVLQETEATNMEIASLKKKLKKARQKAKRRADAGADSDGGQAPPPPPPPPAEVVVAVAECECGQPIGTEAGMCPKDGPCMIDTLAAEAKAKRELATMEPLDLTVARPGPAPKELITPPPGK